MKIGFIGLGIMGKPMAINLIKAGHELVVSSHNEAKAAELIELGASAARTPREIAAQVELVITMLPNSPHVRHVALGTDGLMEAARSDLIYVDMSSIAPATAQEVAGALGERAVKMLDAPVSGGEPKAVDGSLSIMVGGDRETFDQVRDVLSVMGAQSFMLVTLGLATPPSWPIRLSSPSTLPPCPRRSYSLKRQAWHPAPWSTPSEVDSRAAQSSRQRRQ